MPDAPAQFTQKDYRALRDMEDGHLTLLASVQYFDPHTGAELPVPRVQYVGHDRYDVALDWWKPFLAAGFIALPAKGRGNRCTVTDAGRVWLAEHDTEKD